jgi:hypothetical protein
VYVQAWADIPNTGLAEPLECCEWWSSARISWNSTSSRVTVSRFVPPGPHNLDAVAAESCEIQEMRVGERNNPPRNAFAAARWREMPLAP